MDNNQPLEERYITVKRKYTENHPEKTVGKAAKIRNKVLEAIKDGKLTKEEFDSIVREMTVDSTRWLRRNSTYFNVSEDGITLSKTGKRVLNELAPVNEGLSVFDERHFGKKGIIIMIDDNGKKVSAVFKDKKNADKYDRNKESDLKTLLDLAKKTSYPKAIDESKINEKASAFKQANVMAEEIFGEFGIATLDYDQISRVIDIKRADKLAKKYGEDSFMALTELDMEELLNKNPKLVKENKSNNMKSKLVFESFSEFVESLSASTNESTEMLTEAFKSSLLASLFNDKYGKFDKNLASAFYGSAKVKMDLIEDEDLLTLDPQTAYKNKQADTIIFYLSDTPKENPYAPSDAWTDHKHIPGQGYLLAVASGDNAFYTRSWGSRYSSNREQVLKKVENGSTDSIGISKKYKGWDGTGLYNVKRIAEVADRAIVLNMALLRQKYSSANQRDERASAKAGAIAFKSDKDFKKDNMDRYQIILQNKASKLPLDKMVADAIDMLTDQIKTGLAKGEKTKYGEISIGTNKKGNHVKMRDASNHMSNILDNYSRYCDYVEQEKESVERYGAAESWYSRSIKQYAKEIKDGISKIESFDYAW